MQIIVGKKTVVGLLFPVSIILLLFLFYGTASPCGILKKTIIKDYLSDLSEDDVKNQNGSPSSFGNAIGMAVGLPLIDRMIDSLTPLECLNALYKQSYKEEGILSENNMGSTKAGVPMSFDEYTNHIENEKPQLVDPKNSAGQPISADEFLESP